MNSEWQIKEGCEFSYNEKLNHFQFRFPFCHGHVKIFFKTYGEAIEWLKSKGYIK